MRGAARGGGRGGGGGGQKKAGVYSKGILEVRIKIITVTENYDNDSTAKGDGE